MLMEINKNKLILIIKVIIEFWVQNELKSENELKNKKNEN